MPSLELGLPVNCEGRLFLAHFVVVADLVALYHIFDVDRLADIDVVVEKTGGSEVVRRMVGTRRLDMRWFWSTWLQEALLHLLINVQVALLDPGHDFHLFSDFAPPSLLPNRQTSSFLLFSVCWSPSRPLFPEIPLIFDSDPQTPDFFCGFAGSALAAHLVSCSRLSQSFSWAEPPLSEVFL